MRKESMMGKSEKKFFFKLYKEIEISWTRGFEIGLKSDGRVFVGYK